MTPYYSEDGITIWHADCRDVPWWRGGGVDESYCEVAARRLAQGVLAFG